MRFTKLSNDSVNITKGFFSLYNSLILLNAMSRSIGAEAKSIHFLI